MNAFTAAHLVNTFAPIGKSNPVQPYETEEEFNRRMDKIERDRLTLDLIDGGNEPDDYDEAE